MMNSFCKIICLIFAGISILAVRVQGEEQVPNESLRHEKIDRESNARYPVTKFQLEQNSTTPAAPDTGVRSATLKSKATGSTQQNTQPNIVLLISDDDDYEHFGFMDDKIARTPTLDALAKSEALFTMAHCPAPLCRPSV